MNDTERAILARFNRAPVRAHGENSDGAGHVLIRNVDHFYKRPFHALVDNGLLAYHTRCGCHGPCACCNGGWHITPAGVAALGA